MYLPDELPFNEKFQVAGFSSTYYLLNMQPDILVFFGALLLLVPWILLLLLAKLFDKLRRLKNFLQRLIFWRAPIRIMMEIYLELVMFATI